MDNLNKQIDDLRKLKIAIHELRKVYDEIEDEEMQENTKKIIIISDKIYKEVAINTEKISKIKNFASYYLTTIQKVISKYCELKEKGIDNKDVQSLYMKIEQFLPKALAGFEKMYDSLFNNEIVDVDAEIKVMLKELGV